MNTHEVSLKPEYCIPMKCRSKINFPMLDTQHGTATLYTILSECCCPFSLSHSFLLLSYMKGHHQMEKFSINTFWNIKCDNGSLFLKMCKTHKAKFSKMWEFSVSNYIIWQLLEWFLLSLSSSFFSHEMIFQNIF